MPSYRIVFNVDVPYTAQNDEEATIIAKRMVTEIYERLGQKHNIRVDIIKENS